METNTDIRRSVFIPEGVQVRASETEGEPSRVIEGYALKFGVRSRLLVDRKMREIYYEVLEPGCVTREMLDKSDIRLTLFHDQKIILARSKNGAGTLEYEVDDTGVKFRATMPNTVYGDNALSMVSRGDVDGCSFIYSTREKDPACVTYERSTEEGEDIRLRHVHDIKRVYDFTLTPSPAYEQTEVYQRDMEEMASREQPPADEDPGAHKRETLARFREAMKRRL